MDFLSEENKKRVLDVAKASYPKIEASMKKTFTWAMRHKALVACLFLVLYIMLRPASKQVKETIVVEKSLQPTTIPSPAPDENSQQAGDLQLFSPEDKGADPNWSKKVDLTPDKVLERAKEVEDLNLEIGQSYTQYYGYEQVMNQLLDQKLVDRLWSAVRASSLKDTSLPADWYEVIKERNHMVSFDPEALAALFQSPVQLTIGMRLKTVRVRVIGGQILTGDELFLMTSKAYFDRQLEHLKIVLPPAEKVLARVQQEFPDLGRLGAS